MDWVEHRTTLDVVAITDHEDVAGGLRAREYAARMGYTAEVVPGAEVTTLHGHVLALWVETTPRPFAGIEATITAIHEQGGLAVIPHPLSWLTRSVSERTLRRLAEARDSGCWPDAIELANPSPAGLRTAARASALNDRLLRLPVVGGSDAHHLGHIGCGWTEFEGATANGLRAAIHDGTVRGGSIPYPGIRETGVLQVLAGLGWGYTATPRKIVARMVPR